MPILSQLMPKARALQSRVLASIQWQLTLVMRSVCDPCHLLAGCFRALGRVGLVLLRFGTSHNTLQLVKTPQFHLSVILNVKKIFESVQNKTKSFYQNVSAGSSASARCLLLEPMLCIANSQKYDEDKWLDQKIFSRKSQYTQTHKKKGCNWTS